MKKILIWTAGALCGGWLLSGCGKASVEEVEKNIFVNQPSAELFVGEEVVITASPAGETFSWTSEDPSIASVTATGTIRAESEGETNIIVSYGEVQRAVPVSVENLIAATGLSVSKTSLELELRPNGSATLTASLLPENSNDRAAIVWQSTNPAVAKVTGGIVEPVSEGSATIIVTLEGKNNIRAEIPVKVDYTSPFNGPHVISAATPCILQARDFDYGGLGYAFHDNARNVGSPNYRPEIVSGNMPNVESGAHIGGITAGEWLLFTVEVEDVGNYLVDFEITANNAAANVRTFHLEVDFVDVTGLLQTPNNGSWSAFEWISVRYPEAIPLLPIIPLTEGMHRIRLYFDTAGYNFRALKFTHQP
jgi:hypothetical protein